MLVGLLLGLWAAPAAAAETVVRFGTVAPEGSRYMKDMRAMGDEMERMSGGALQIKWYSAGRLGDERAMARTLMAKDGQLEGAGLTGVGLGLMVPEMRIWVMPGLFQSYDEVHYLKARFRDEFVAYFEQRGLVLLTWSDVGFTYVLGDVETKTLAELKARRIWFWADDDTSLALMKLLGFKTDASSLGALAAALIKKQIDAWVFPPLGVISFMLQKHGKYMIDVPMTFLAGAMVVRKDVFDALPADARRAVLAVGRKWEKRLAKAWKTENQNAIEAMKKQGTRLVVWTPEEKQRFFQMAAAERGAFAKALGLEALVRRVGEDLEAFRAAQR